MQVILMKVVVDGAKRDFSERFWSEDISGKCGRGRRGGGGENKKTRNERGLNEERNFVLGPWHRSSSLS